MNKDLNRRGFFSQSLLGLSAAWLSAHWPAILSAADHAHRAAHSASPPPFEFFSPEQAREIDAIIARLIPADDTPGAREAGVIYFIDRALRTFASDSAKAYADGLQLLQSKTHELFPQLGSFSAASPDQQDTVLRALEKHVSQTNDGTFLPSSSNAFFETVRFHTVMGFLADPSRGGNRDEIGWKLIGFEGSHFFQPPFGFYDKDYSGWQPHPEQAAKK
jgi:Gluconate 2-dehydrogenase subunit 3